MKLKIEEINGTAYAVLADGKPVYIADDGKETSLDAAALTATITRLNGEAMGHRKAKETAEAALKAFEGLTDPEAARKALATVANLDAKKLIDAGEVERVKSEISKAFEIKLTAAEKDRDEARTTLHREMIGGAFARSKFVADKVAVPVDMLQAAFGSRFGMDGGKIVAKDQNGNTVYSRANPGEPAGFDEALEIIVTSYPHKDSILKGTGAQGSGAKPSGTGGAGAKTMTRAEFEAMTSADPAGTAKKMADGYKVV